MGDSPGIDQPPFDVHAWAQKELARTLDNVRKMCATGWRLKANEDLQRAADMDAPRDRE